MSGLASITAGGVAETAAGSAGFWIEACASAGFDAGAAADFGATG